MSWNKWFGGPGGIAPGGRRSPLSRRAFLGGGAVALSLPWLESLRPAGASPPQPPTRLLFWYLPCGIVMDAWTPGSAGALGTLPTILAPLEAHKDQLLVLTGLANRAANVPVAGDHARGTGSYLTCMECQLSTTNIRNGISIDQVVANAIGDQTLYESLEIGTTGGASVGNCDSGYSCAYTNNISWIDEDTPKPKLTDPALVFDRLFAGFDSELTLEEAEKRRTWRTSVLDHVLEDANQLDAVLSTSDRAKLDEFMTGVRDLEGRITTEPNACLPGERPSSNLDYALTTRAMSDLTVLALQCDLTRVVSFMMENGGSYRSFDFIGVTGAHHELSHHQSSASKIADLTVIDTWQMAEFAYLLDRLKQTGDVFGGNLLDNTVAMASSEISDGDWHNHDDLPVILAGGGGGALQMGRHKIYDQETPIADLFIALADIAGVPVASFGQDGTQPVDLS